jgi:hypothetical protein
LDYISAYANARHDALSRFWRALIIALVLLVQLFADGGILLLQQRTGPLIVNVFAAPVPLRAGAADLSILLQNAADNSAVLGGAVQIELIGPGGQHLNVVATHGASTNKLLFAANVNLSAPGEWRVIITGLQLSHRWTVSGLIRVLPGEPAAIAYWPYFAVLPAVIALFALNQWLKRKRRASMP